MAALHDGNLERMLDLAFINGLIRTIIRQHCDLVVYLNLVHELRIISSMREAYDNDYEQFSFMFEY